MPVDQDQNTLELSPALNTDDNDFKLESDEKTKTGLKNKPPTALSGLDTNL